MVALNISVEFELSLDLASAIQEVVRMATASVKICSVGWSLIRTAVRAALPQELQAHRLPCVPLS